MASRPRTRKRVCAVRRASDGSAFEKCERCGISVAVALADMHQCEPDKGVKRFRGINVNHHVPNHSFGDQPISPFRLFMEDFVKDCETADMIEIDRSGFEVWKNMSKEQRQPYVSQAEKVNSAYEEALNKEVNDMIQVDDEADSAMVGKFDKFHQSYEESSEYSEYYTEFSGQDDCERGATLHYEAEG
ncbi:high mobility group B protein 7 [Senna tora]|uniref:High mobility group B protein 7 n=1 Tax=Senna tora TaxID=362788 RepID=A0A834TYG6_9FABA|nr:high mobility group B protein 7 [Senna tora]